MSMQQYCTFTVDGTLFGVDVHEIQEVIRYQEMTRVPLSASVVSGLINLRGQIVTAIDMRTRLSMPPRAEGQKPMNVVLRTEDGAVSLLVDEIGDVIQIDETSFEEAPPTLESGSRDLLKGVYKLDRQLLLVLDSRKALPENNH
jgi:purine-binding chemotaxis protein CheW